MLRPMLCKMIVAALLAGATLSSSFAQVPVIDHTREKIQQTTQQWYDNYQKNQQTTRGNSGDTTNSYAPGQGAGAMDCLSFGGGAGWGTRLVRTIRAATQEQIRQMVADEARRQGSTRISLWRSRSRNRVSDRVRSRLSALAA